MLLPFAMVVCVHPQELQPMPMATHPTPRLSTPLTSRLKWHIEWNWTLALMGIAFCHGCVLALIAHVPPPKRKEKVSEKQSRFACLVMMTWQIGIDYKSEWIRNP